MELARVFAVAQITAVRHVINDISADDLRVWIRTNQPSNSRLPLLTMDGSKDEGRFKCRDFGQISSERRKIISKVSGAFDDAVTLSNCRPEIDWLFLAALKVSGAR